MVKPNTKKISRGCIVCGKRITITLYKNGSYSNGHYFGKMKFPIGKGEYKKVGTSRLFGKKTDVVEWTGEERKIEHWECNSCYEEGQQEV